MDKKTYIVVGVVVVLAVGLFLLGRSTAPTPQYIPVGGVSFEDETFTQGFETFAPAYIGGKKTTLTAGATVTITADQFCDSSILSFAPSQATASTTLPTAASINSQCLTTDGQRHSLWFTNTGAAASTTIMKAGTGMVLMEPDGQNVVIAGSTSKVMIDCVRYTSTEVWCTIDEVIDAD